MRIEVMRPELADDWLAFFDETAFADNPEWSPCYCRVFEFPHESQSWEQACAANANRPVMAAAAARGDVHGFLAYDEDRVVGWCRAGARGLYRGGHSGIRATDAGDDEATLATVCFIVAASHRRRGVARQLLEAACASAETNGYVAIEGYALKDVPAPADGLSAEAELFRGPRGLFDALRFEPVAETERYWIMRRPASGDGFRALP